MTQLKRIDLKIQKKYFDDIVSRKKTFELRKNDRGFKVGDYVRLNVVDSYNEFIDIQITYILENVEEYGLKSGYCIFGFKILEEEKMNKMTKQELVELEKQEKMLGLYKKLDECIVAPEGHHVCRYTDDEKYARIRKQIKELEKNELNTKEKLVEYIKENFRDEYGDIDLNGLDFSGENVYIGYMKAKNIFQSYQEVEKDLYQHNQTVEKDLWQGYQNVGENLWQNNQEVGKNLYQDNQDVKGKIFQVETKKDQDETKKDQDETKKDQDETKIDQDETKIDQDETKIDQDETKIDNVKGKILQDEIECIDAIEEVTEDLQGIEAVDTGMAIKYLWRWKNKNGVEDLKKAQWYINHLIEINEKE